MTMKTLLSRAKAALDRANRAMGLFAVILMVAQVPAARCFSLKGTSAYGRSTIGGISQMSRTNDINQVISNFGLLNDTAYGANLIPKAGHISLVGAGPGDPELLTVAAIRRLQGADLVVSDRLVSQEILDFVKCELKIARKRPGCAEEAQEEIYDWCKEGLAAGKRVVRLKIGDPLIFGRGGEEILRFREWGYKPELVAGVSSAFSAPLLGNIPLTHRGFANQLVIGTGYGQNCTKTGITPYHPERTAVFLMAVGRLPTLCTDLAAEGYPADCPVAIIEKASTPEQRLVLGKISSIVALAEEHRVKPPSIVVFGAVVAALHGAKEGLVAPEEMDEFVEAAWARELAREEGTPLPLPM